MSRTIAICAAFLVGLSTAAAAQDPAPYQVSIVSPDDLSTVFSDTGEVTVDTKVVPPLASGDHIELLVDEQQGPPSSSLQFALAGLPRGLHLLEARVIDASGNVAAISAASTFYVWAASTRFPNRAK
jgi:hypothetical protein